VGSKVASDSENKNQWGSWLGLSATSIPDKPKLINNFAILSKVHYA
jgi:hypothetical protein